MNLDADLYSASHIPLESAKTFVEKILPKFGWGKLNRDEIILDVGCGPGGTTKELILPLFSKSSKIFAVDVVPSMIALAEKQNSSPQIEYSVADIEDWSTIKRFENKFTKLISISVFQWMRDQRMAFLNLYNLLQIGGEAALFFPLQSLFHDAILDMQKSSKWGQYFHDVETYIPESHKLEYDASHYQKILSNMDFEVLHCKSEMKIDIFPSKETYQEFFTSICVLRKYVPLERLEEFENDFMEILNQRNGCVANELPFHKGCFIELVIRKIS